MRNNTINFAQRALGSTFRRQVTHHALAQTQLQPQVKVPAPTSIFFLSK